MEAERAREFTVYNKEPARPHHTPIWLKTSFRSATYGPKPHRPIYRDIKAPLVHYQYSRDSLRHTVLIVRFGRPCLSPEEAGAASRCLAITSPAAGNALCRVNPIGCLQGMGAPGADASVQPGLVDETGRLQFCDRVRRTRRPSYVAFDLLWQKRYRPTVSAAQRPLAAVGAGMGVGERLSSNGSIFADDQGSKP